MSTSLKLDADSVNALLRSAFPSGSSTQFPTVLLAEPGRVEVVMPYNPGMLRPGNLISGPTQMGLADTAAYALVLTHLGPELMAVTSSMLVNFLRPCRPGDLRAEGMFLKLGRRQAVCDIRIWTESRERLAAQATVTYALPQ